MAENCLAAGSQLNQPTMYKWKAGKGLLLRIMAALQQHCAKYFPALGAPNLDLRPQPIRLTLAGPALITSAHAPKMGLRAVVAKASQVGPQA